MKLTFDLVNSTISKAYSMFEGAGVYVKSAIAGKNLCCSCGFTGRFNLITDRV